MPKQFFFGAKRLETDIDLAVQAHINPAFASFGLPDRLLPLGGPMAAAVRLPSGGGRLLSGKACRSGRQADAGRPGSLSRGRFFLLGGGHFHDLLGCRQAGNDFLPAVLAQRPHAFAHGQPLDLVRGGLADDHVLDILIDGKEFIDRHPAEKSRLVARGASFAFIHLDVANGF